MADTVTGANRISLFTSLLPLIVCGDTVVFGMFFTILTVTSVEKNTTFLNHLDFPLQGGFSLQEEAAPRSRTGQRTHAEAALRCPSRASTFWCLWSRVAASPWEGEGVVVLFWGVCGQKKGWLH